MCERRSESRGDGGCSLLRDQATDDDKWGGTKTTRVCATSASIVGEMVDMSGRNLGTWIEELRCNELRVHYGQSIRTYIITDSLYMAGRLTVQSDYLPDVRKAGLLVLHDQSRD